MKEVELTRTPSTTEGTFGSLVVDDKVFKTGELPWRDNQRGISCIPAGSYLCQWRQSPSKGWVYHIQNVPGRENCLIHSANFCGSEDAGFEAQLRGCIALGLSIGELENSNGDQQMAVLHSHDAVDQFNEYMDQQDFMLVIK